MYDKILQALTKAAGENSGINTKTLEAQAAMAAKIVTTDEVLALYDAKSVIDSIVGDRNHYMKLHNDKIKKEQEKEKLKKEKETKAAEEEAARQKKLKEDTETPDWAKEIMEQNRLQGEQIKIQNESIEALKTDKITTSRTTQVETILKDLPDILTDPIKKSFKTTVFENEEDFTAYLETMKTTKDTFVQNAAEGGINITLPKKDVKKVELNGQSKELHSALNVLEKQKEKENKK